jgi:hypothetical protein
MKCDKCDGELKAREGWIDLAEEYRHIEFFHCIECDTFYSIDGKKIELTVEDV